MADHVLTIDTPEGEIEFSVSALINGELLSDSRAQMPDLKKIAKALGLSEDATEETIVAKIADRAEVRGLDPKVVADALGLDDTSDNDKIVSKAKELADSGEEKSLEDRAKDEGKVVLDADGYNALKADAKRGAEAADQLKQSRFDAAYDKALREIRVDSKDETRERFQKLYDAAPDLAIEQLDAMPKLANSSAAGSGQSTSDTPENVDEDRFDLDQEARSLMADKDLTYEQAIDRVLADRSRA